MKRKGWWLYVALVLGLYCPANGQLQKVVLDHASPGLMVNNNTPHQLDLSFSIPSFSVDQKINSYGSFSRIIIKGFSHTDIAGIPELPVLSKLIVIPEGTVPQVRIIRQSTKVLLLDSVGIYNKIWPVQPSVHKKQAPVQQKFYYLEQLYQTDTLLFSPLLSIKKAGVLRGRQLSVLTISPFSYNPSSGRLKIVTHAKIEIHFVPKGTMSGSIAKFNSAVFQPVLSDALNFKSEAPPLPSSHAVKYVILSDSTFRQALQPFIHWKTKKGFQVIEVYKGTPGVGTTAEEMKNYLSSLYHSATPEDPAFSYLLIVGDDEQIPAFRTNQITDLYFAEYDGNGDFMPDVFYGRFPAKDTLELNAEIEKTLEYEQYLFPDPSFLNEAVMIAGMDGSYASEWGNGQINYGTQYYFNGSHNIQSHTYLYPESGSMDAQIIQDVSNGAGFVNYTGHGEWNRWIDPTFSISNIDSLKNHHKYPLMIGNGCVTTVFNYDNCFGEALLKAKDKGALGYIGCSNDSYWDEDFWWAVGIGQITAHPVYEETGQGMYDLAFHDHGELKNRWAQTQGQFIFAGNMAVTEAGSRYTKYYWEIYHLMGDPSLSVYFSVPDSIPASFSPFLPVGSSHLQIFSIPNIYAGLSLNDSLLAGGFANEDGLIDLNFSTLNDTGNVILVLTGQNRKPFITHIPVVHSNEPFVLLDSVVLDDNSGNSNHLADYSENLYMAVYLKNYGSQEAVNVEGKLKSHSNLISLDDTLAIWDTIPGGEIKMISHAFQIEIHDSVPDQSQVTLNIQTTDQNGSIYNSYYPLKINAPALRIRNIEIDDNLWGNGNRRLDPGEKATVMVVFENYGHSKITNLSANLGCTDTLLKILTDTVYITELDSMATQVKNFLIGADTGIPAGKLDYLSVNLGNATYHTSDSFPVSIGIMYEDFESGDFKRFPWVEDPVAPWRITPDKQFEGIYSAVSGKISDYQSSSLLITCYNPQPDSISFQYKVSSESDYDFLQFFIDDTLVSRWSGEINWSHAQFPVGQGDHKFKWSYHKDESVSSGFDRSWVDFIVFPKNGFVKNNTGITKLIHPVSGTELTGSEDIELTITNFGIDTLYNIPAGYLLNNQITRDTLHATLPPGQNVLFRFSQQTDLSLPGDYNFTFFTSLPFDEVPENDTLTATIRHLTEDAGISRIFLPEGDTLFSDHQSISVVVQNYGTTDLLSIPVVYRINEAPEVREAVDTLIHPGDSLEYVFLAPADLSAFDTFYIKAFTELLHDYSAGNDTCLVVLEHNDPNSVGSRAGVPGLTVFPNPVGETLHLYFTNNKGKYQIFVRDITGREMFQKAIYVTGSMYITNIDMNHYVPGIYFLQIDSGTRRMVRKIIKY